MGQCINGAAIMTVIVRVYLVHLVHVKQCQVAADPQSKSADSGLLFVYSLLSSASTISIY